MDSIILLQKIVIEVKLLVRFALTLVFFWSRYFSIHHFCRACSSYTREDYRKSFSQQKEEENYYRKSVTPVWLLNYLADDSTCLPVRLPLIPYLYIYILYTRKYINISSAQFFFVFVFWRLFYPKASLKSFYRLACIGNFAYIYMRIQQNSYCNFQINLGPIRLK